MGSKRCWKLWSFSPAAYKHRQSVCNKTNLYDLVVPPWFCNSRVSLFVFVAWSSLYVCLTCLLMGYTKFRHKLALNDRILVFSVFWKLCLLEQKKWRNCPLVIFCHWTWRCSVLAVTHTHLHVCVCVCVFSAMLWSFIILYTYKLFLLIIERWGISEGLKAL